jgi:hypothetical protein
VSLDELDASELRAELDDATHAALDRLDDLINAVESGDLFYAASVGLAAKAAAARVKRLRNALRLGVAA